MTIKSNKNELREGGQFGPERGGLFKKKSGGQFGPKQRGQLQPKTGGQFDRNFHINYNFEKDEVVNLTIFNLLGEIVGMYNMKSEEKLYSLDLTHLSSGVYTVKSESSSKPISVNRIILLK